jgi:hypothetical protein
VAWKPHPRPKQQHQIIQKRALRIICPGKDYNEALKRVLAIKCIALSERA